MPQERSTHPDHGPGRRPKPPRPKAETAIATATRQWLTTLPQNLSQELGLANDAELVLAEAPKRHTLYMPMVILPSGSFGSPRWKAILSHPALSRQHIDGLWRSILARLSQSSAGSLTHLAINEGIPPVLGSDGDAIGSSAPNTIRSPLAMRILYGDFGPAETTASPSEEDFAKAFWVTTKQVGFHQTWAPRWTMFSRGNIKEKERLVAFHSDPLTPARGSISFASAGNAWAVDMYAGIGYFSFAYARQGAHVLCWEINPWSVEALRRGAQANGWPVRVVRGASLALPTSQLVTGDERIVVFLEDNQNAPRRIQELRESGFSLNIVHVNCGLLPRSDLVWRPSWEVTSSNDCRDCWLHLHENVGVHDIERRRDEIQKRFEGWSAHGPEGSRRLVQVEHVEKVKTYAPDVWHCVFDVYIILTNGV